MSDLDLSCTISSPAGGTLNLQSSGVYKLEASTLNDKQVQHRKIIAKNPYVEGEFVVASVRENVTETLAVWVYATTAAILRTRLDALTACFDQVQYAVVFRDDTITETWAAQAADYSIKSSGPLRVARMALVSAQVPRRPTVVLS